MTDTALAALAATGVAILASSSPSFAAQGEAARVIREACGDEPEPDCVAKLTKVCSGTVSFRC